jgi:hypothetical protein
VCFGLGLGRRLPLGSGDGQERRLLGAVSVLVRAVLPVGTADRLGQVSARRDDELRLGADRLLNGVHERVVRRVGDRHDGDRLVEADRQRVEETSLLLGEEARGFGVDVLLVEPHEAEALLPGEERREVLLFQEPALDEDLAEPAAGANALLEGVLDRLGRQQAGPEDQGSQRGVGTFSQWSAHSRRFAVDRVFRLACRIGRPSALGITRLGGLRATPSESGMNGPWTAVCSL